MHQLAKPPDWSSSQNTKRLQAILVRRCVRGYCSLALIRAIAQNLEHLRRPLANALRVTASAACAKL